MEDRMISIFEGTFADHVPMVVGPTPNLWVELINQIGNRQAKPGLNRCSDAEALAFAGEGKVKATIEILPLESINEVFSRLKKGQINGRVVLGLRQETPANTAIARTAS